MMYETYESMYMNFTVCFTQDGDYNKPIPTQYNGDLNHPVSCEQGDFISNNDVLCEKCSRNQLLKTKQLAAFVPLNEVLSY